MLTYSSTYYQPFQKSCFCLPHLHDTCTLVTRYTISYLHYSGYLYITHFSYLTLYCFLSTLHLNPSFSSTVTTITCLTPQFNLRQLYPLNGLFFSSFLSSLYSFYIILEALDILVIVFVLLLVACFDLTISTSKIVLTYLLSTFQYAMWE